MSATGRRARYREQREAVRREILAAAGAFLRERPYRELSVEALMSGTGLARTTFYRHFDDVPHLVLRLLGELMRDLYAVGQRWSEAAGEDPPAPAMAGLAGTVDFFAQHGPLLRAISDAATTDETIEHGQRELREAFIALTAQTLERLVQAGQVEVPDVPAMARALNLMNEAYLLEEFGRPPLGSRETALATLQTIWLRTLGPGAH